MKSGSRINRLSVAGLGFALTWTPVSAWAQTSVTVSPKRAAVAATTQTQQFTSSAANVTWSVDRVTGGNATVGTSGRRNSHHHSDRCYGTACLRFLDGRRIGPVRRSHLSQPPGAQRNQQQGICLNPNHFDHVDVWQAVFVPCRRRSLRAAAVDQGLEHRRRCAQRHFRRHTT